MKNSMKNINLTDDMVNVGSNQVNLKKQEPVTAELRTGPAEDFKKVAGETGRASRVSVASPYYTKEEAAAYLRTSVSGVYGRVERKQLERCPGVREYLFTKEMLDDSVMRKMKKAPLRRKGR